VLSWTLHEQASAASSAAATPLLIRRII
jgi:hypothetical protein